MTGRAGRSCGRPVQPTGLSRAPAPSPCGESGPRSLAEEGAAAASARERGTDSTVSAGPPHCRHLGPPFFAARRGCRPPSPTRLAQAGPSAPAFSPAEPRVAIGGGAVMDGGGSQWHCSPAALALPAPARSLPLESGSSEGRGGSDGGGLGLAPAGVPSFLYQSLLCLGPDRWLLLGFSAESSRCAG